MGYVFADAYLRESEKSGSLFMTLMVQFADNLLRQFNPPNPQRREAPDSESFPPLL